MSVKPCWQPRSGIARSVCFRGYYWLTGRGSLLALIDHLDRLHFATRPEIDGQVQRNLHALLSHASRTIPYYRECIDGNKLTPMTAQAALQDMPILTKDTIRRKTEQLISERPGKRLHWNTSGGSTGEPIRLLQDLRMKRMGRVTELLFMRWAGHKWGEPHVLIWGVPQQQFHERISLHERIFRLVHNETYLNCYRITDDILHSWITSINALRPTVIEAYVDAIHELSRVIAKQNLQVVGPRAIITSAGVLVPDVKNVVEGVFRCPVFNRYGSREVGNVACSCGIGNELHVDEFTCYVEIVDEEGKPCEEGVEGDILVTLLTNYTMPLIRYKIEDRGVWASGRCACGRNTRRLAAVVGRESDYLTASDGSRVNGTALTTLLYPVSSIRRYQYRQIDRDRVVLAVVPNEAISAASVNAELQHPLKRLKAMLGNVRVSIAVVDDIAPSGSGKYRYVLNNWARGDHS